MLGSEYVIAFIKILFDIGFAIITAIPATIAWNFIAPKYISFLPEVYLNIPYWHMVAIFLVCTYFGSQIKKLTPTIVSVSSS